MPSGNCELSIVIPVYCEQESLPELYRRVTAVLNGPATISSYELIFINDGSTDRTPELLREIAKADSHVKVLFLSRNFGHQKAITAGLDYCMGRAAIVLDADLQDPPEIIPEMLACWRQGNQVVYATRRRREGEFFLRTFCIRLFYQISQLLTDTYIPPNAGDFRLLDAQVISALKELREENRYLRGLIAWVGFRQSSIEYDRPGRFAGRSKYSIRRLIRLALDGITGFSNRPLRVASILGIMTTFVALGLMLWVIAAHVFSPQTAAPWGWTSLMVAILFIGGIQLLCVGMLGEYIGRIFNQTKGRPLYVLSEKLGFAPEPYDP